MSTLKTQSGFAHILVLLAVLIIGGGILFALYKFNLLSFPWQTKKVPPVSPVQGQAWVNLKNKAQKEATLYVGETTEPRLISGNFSGFEDKKTPEAVAWAFIEQNKELYKMNSPQQELKLNKIEPNENFTAVIFDQYYQNIPVFGGTLVVRVTKDLKIDSVASSFVPGINTEINPKISKEEAIKKSQEDSNSASELMIYSPGVYDQSGAAKLTWKITGNGQDLFISAISGELLSSYATAYQAMDRETYTSQETSANQGKPWIREKGNAPSLPTGEPDSEGQAVFKNLGITYNYFNNRLGRDGWDGKGGKIISSVHFRDNPGKVYNNSSWSGGEKRIRFGTGWGFALDVAAHEFTHGVIQSTSNLNYQGQSGAINEALADIFGTFTEFYSGGNNWTIGEGNTTIKILRDMKYPLKFNQPGKFGDSLYQNPASVCNNANDYCGVHQNNSIVNKPAQLLVEGGFNNNLVVLPIGQEKTEQLFYYLMTQRLIASSQFSDLRAEAIEGAKSGFTGAGAKYTFSDIEKTSVINAFASAGIGTLDANYDGIADDVKDPGSGITIITSQKTDDKIFTSGCPEPTEFIIRVLPASFGKADIKVAGIWYKYAGDKDYSQGELFKTGSWDDGGELKEAKWYQFRIANLPEAGEVDYQINLGGQNAQPKNLDGKITVLKCKIKQNPLDSAKNLTTKTNINQISLTPTPTANLIIVPTSIPTVAQIKNLTVSADGALSGFIASNGRIGTDPVAGELSPGSRAFLSFDLSGLPDNAAIQSAQLVLDGATATNDPFSLGDLAVMSYFYDSLDNTDYRADGSTIGSMSSLSNNSFDVTSYVRSIFSRKKFQVRLQFNQDVSDNRTVDYLTFPSDRMKLKISYND